MRYAICNETFEGWDHARVCRTVAERIHLVPPYTRKLAHVPLRLDHPYWVEDPDFSVEHHLPLSSGSLALAQSPAYSKPWPLTYPAMAASALFAPSLKGRRPRKNHVDLWSLPLR